MTTKPGLPANFKPLEQGQVIWKGSLEEGSLRKLITVINKDLAGSELLVVGLAIFEPGQVAPIHVHPDSEEFDVVLKGRAQLYRVSGEKIDLAEGDIQFIPKGAPHAHGNPGDEPLWLLFAYTPPTDLPAK
ncbi:MAG: cupin domain-containing protein [Actinobacteria bacterium]|nr:cupin domain-containing protein [Actinomycetota bacterium]